MLRLFFSLCLSASLWALPGSGLARDLLYLDITGKNASGRVVIELFTKSAPENTARIKRLASEGKYDGIAFHRVVDRFMAQTGDVQYGKHDGKKYAQAGYGGSDLPDLPPEFSDDPFVRGTVGMARGGPPDSANSQFFIVLRRSAHLDTKYTLVGRVISGMGVVDQLTRGNRDLDGFVTEDPDYIRKAQIVSR